MYDSLPSTLKASFYVPDFELIMLQTAKLLTC